MEYLVSIILAIFIARIGRFFAAHDNGGGLRCYDVGRDTDYSGVYCERLKGHLGLHRTAPMGALRWYQEWKTGEKPRTIGLDIF